MARSVVRVVVRGRVQGVWFRGWTVEQARSLRLRGWVRNRKDGSVEALFGGTDSDVREMLQRVRTGPPGAAVSEVEEHPSSDPLPEGFGQRGTA
jgi:acylphosphatase